MTAKEYLLEIRRYERALSNVKMQSEKLHESFAYLKGVSYDRDKVQTSPTDTMSEQVSRLIDIERELERATLEYHTELNKRIKQINGLSKSEYIAILTARYIKNENFETISCEINYSYYRTCRMHGDALKEFTEKYLN